MQSETLKRAPWHIRGPLQTIGQNQSVVADPHSNAQKILTRNEIKVRMNKDADPGIPLLKQAQSEYAKLQ